MLFRPPTLLYHDSCSYFKQIWGLASQNLKLCGLNSKQSQIAALAEQRTLAKLVT